MAPDLTASPVERQNMDMAEHQTSEYKQIWKAEYLKWVCGFANAQGGKLYIGKNDRPGQCRAPAGETSVNAIQSSAGQCVFPIRSYRIMGARH